MVTYMFCPFLHQFLQDVPLLSLGAIHTAFDALPLKPLLLPCTFFTCCLATHAFPFSVLQGNWLGCSHWKSPCSLLYPSVFCVFCCTSLGNVYSDSSQLLTIFSCSISTAVILKRRSFRFSGSGVCQIHCAEEECGLLVIHDLFVGENRCWLEHQLWAFREGGRDVLFGCKEYGYSGHLSGRRGKPMLDLFGIFTKRAHHYVFFLVSVVSLMHSARTPEKSLRVFYFHKKRKRCMDGAQFRKLNKLQLKIYINYSVQS